MRCFLWQIEHVALPEAEYFPRGHATQATCPALRWCCPAAQAEQATDAASGATVPAPQRVHEAEAAPGEYVPTAQLAQDVGWGDPERYMPALQDLVSGWMVGLVSGWPVGWGVGWDVGLWVTS